MTKAEKSVREPLFHIAKRNGLPFWKSWVIRVLSVVAALLVCAVVIVLFTGDNPVSIYKTMIQGAIGTSRRVWGLLQSIAMLLCVSLAVTPAFKMRFWNIGAEGQVLIGGLATTACMILLGNKVPNALLLVIILIASIVAGAVWAVIPAVFKAIWDTNETLFTLMMNYIAIQIVSYFVYIWSVPAGSGKIGVINGATEAGWLPVLGNQKYMLNILVVGLLTVGVYVYLKHSKHGYEIAVVGESVNTAKYIGINVRKVIIRTMLLSGALWGFIPAFFKAKFNTNETLFTLMMNYVATQLVAFFIIIWEVPKGSGKIGIINQATRAGWVPVIGKYDYLLNILVVFVLTFVLYAYLKYSKHGYEIAVVGESENTARYIGINVKKVILRTMLLSGAICGLAGFLLVGSTNHTVTTTIAGGRGFTAIMVSWLAKFNPLFMILTSALLVILEKGAGEIATVYGLNKSFSDILTGIILFFIIGSEFFINYSVNFRRSHKEGK